MSTTTQSRRASPTKQNRVPRDPQRGPRRREALLETNWDEWVEYLAARKSRAPLCELVPSGSGDPLCWPLLDDWPASDSYRLVQRLTGMSARQKASNGGCAGELEQWLDAARGRSADPPLAIEALAWCHALPALAQLLPAAPWFELLDELVQMAERAGDLELLEDPLSQQLLAGELPFSLSYVLPEFDACRPLGRAARKVLSQGIVELLDGEGLANARHFPQLRALLGCWTRSALLGRAIQQPALDGQGQTQLEWLVRQTLRLSRYDGSQVFSQGDAGAWSPGLMAAALDVAGDEDDRLIAQRALPGRKTAKRGKAEAQLDVPAVHSEWAEAAVLRRAWDRDSERLAVGYAGQTFHCELNCGSATIWSGACNPLVSVDGQPLSPRGEWEEVCWVTDEDADYLELEIELSDRRTLQRQLLLARRDRFLWLADALLGDKSGRLEYEWTLPLDQEIGFRASKETREGVLSGKRQLGLVLPLALPEWRAQRMSGVLEATPQGLRYALEVRGTRLLAPLFIDLDPRRFKRQLTWRQLTVGEELQGVARDVAVGYRIQVGQQQWLMYRSLGPRGNRTVLGQNFTAEFVLGRFTPDGETVKIMEVE